jgi:hypothetical protein
MLQANSRVNAREQVVMQMGSVLLLRKANKYTLFIQAAPSGSRRAYSNEKARQSCFQTAFSNRLRTDAIESWPCCLHKKLAYFDRTLKGPTFSRRIEWDDQFSVKMFSMDYKPTQLASCPHRCRLLVMIPHPAPSGAISCASENSSKPFFRFFTTNWNTNSNLTWKEPRYWVPV